MLSEREELLKSLRAGPIVLRRLVHDLDDTAIRRRPAATEWAIVEVVAHLGDTEERTIARVHRMLAEDEPALPAYDPDTLSREGRYIEMDLSQALDRFESIRSEFVELLGSLNDSGWGRTGRHEEHGAMTVQLLAAHGAGEDGNHLAQIARLIPES